MIGRRLYAPELPAQGGQLELPDESVQHARVLRLTPGDAVELTDTQLGVASAVVVEHTARRLLCDAQPMRRLPAPSPALHLVLGLPKGGKLADMARMLAELGVASLHLAHTERSVPRPARAEERLERLARIAREACLQSGQPLAMTTQPAVPLPEAAARVPAGAHKLLFWEEGGVELPALRALRPAPSGAADQDAWVVVGPEGGLSAHEAQLLTALGYTAVGLGPAVLRVQTAAPVIAALVLDRLGRLRG